MKIIKGKNFKSLKRSLNNNLPVITNEQIEYFNNYGYLIIENFLQEHIINNLISRYQLIFDGYFDTGNYPDEWYGRTGMSLPNITKEICNGWKCDKTIAKVVLSSQLHAITSQLYGWNSSRIAQDDVISKPFSGGSPVQFHRDGSYISDQFIPIHNNSITVWLPLDNVSLNSGTIEYISQSHKWNNVIQNNNFNFHSSNNSCHRTNFLQSITFQDNSINKDNIEFHYVEIPRGGVAFHHQNTFHGSGINITNNIMRRALVLHTLNGDCKFNPERKPSYIYGRYQLQETYETNTGEIEMRPVHELQETFYPVCWNSNSSRSKWLQRYCEDLSSEELIQY